MNKILKRDPRIFSEVLLYIFTLIMGLYLVFYPDFGSSNPLFAIACMFVILAFISFIAYYAGKKEGDYELLLLSLVDIVIAVFLYYFRDGNLAFILSFSLSAWSFFYIILKMITAFQSKFTEPKKYVIRILTAVIILLLSSVSIFKLFNDDALVILLVYGYYFIMVATINFLEITLNKVAFDKDEKNAFKMLPSFEEEIVKPAKVKVLVEEQDEVKEEIKTEEKEVKKEPVKTAPKKKKKKKHTK